MLHRRSTLWNIFVKYIFYWPIGNCVCYLFKEGVWFKKNVSKQLLFNNNMTQEKLTDVEKQILIDFDKEKSLPYKLATCNIK